MLSAIYGNIIVKVVNFILAKQLLNKYEWRLKRTRNERYAIFEKKLI